LRADGRGSRVRATIGVGAFREGGMKIEEHESSALKLRYQIVRTDDYLPVEGRIRSADTDTGVFVLDVPKVENGYHVFIDGHRQYETKEFRWQPGSFKIVERRR
jgi:hypothetical protein